jgi:SRSO17 transposase
MGLTLLERAKANGFSGVVLTDSAYGDVTEFRQALDAEGWRYCVGIEKTLKVIAADADLGEVPPYTGRGRPPSRPEKVRPGATSESVLEWAQGRAGEFRKVTWREGSKGKLSSRFAAWRVRPAHKLSAGQEPLAPCWLLVEWPEGEAAPTKYFFSNLAAGTSLRQLVRTAKGRWWVEHSYKELKDELGLDHFEGRSWRGWQHHVTLVMLAYAFLVLRRRQRRGKKGVAR